MEPTIGEVRLFAGNFAPRGWAFCQGQLLSIAQNTALFSILGTTYGGNGQTTFALPNLSSRVPVGPGTGPGLPGVVEGQMWGSETNTLLITNLPAHNHIMEGNMNPADGTLNNPVNAYMGAGPVDRTTGAPVNTRFASTANASMAADSVGIAGGSQPVNNIQPSLGLNYIIATVGVFPSRN